MSNQQESSDQELIEECLAGDILAWDELIERYRALIYSIPINYGFSEDDADDIFQVTCTKLLEKLPKLRRHEKFRSWLITMVVRHCWRIRQRQRQETPMVDLLRDDEEFDLAADLPSPETSLIDLEQQHLMESAFTMLPQQCRQLLGYLFFYDPPPSYKEVAAETGISFNSIAPIRSRCLEKLKSFFEKEMKRS